MRTFGTMFVGGIAALVLFKLLLGFVLPLLGLLVGLVAMAVKIALVAAVAYFVYSLVRGRRREHPVS